MLLVSVVQCVEGVVARGLGGMRWIENPEILETPCCFDVRQETIEKLAFAFTVEDDHRHFPAPESARQVLGDDVFKEGRFAGAGAADDHAVLHPHYVGPKPSLFVNVVSEQRCRTMVRIASDRTILCRRDEDRR